MRVLGIEVGGTHVPFRTPDRHDPIKLHSGPELTSAAMADAFEQATAGWSFDALTNGDPGPVAESRLGACDLARIVENRFL